MSLLQELQGFAKSLNEKYKRDDMARIIDKYCTRISELPQEEVAKYVLEVDKQRYLTQINDFGKPFEPKFELNDGHVYTGLMNDEKCYGLFEEWFEDTYILESDLSEKLSIEDTIKKHLDPRVECMVVSHLLDKGLTAFKNKETIQNALFEIDTRNDQLIIDNYNKKQNGEKEFKVGLLGREFEKELQKTCFIIANQHEPMEIMEYISKNMDLSYKDDIKTEIYYGGNKLNIYESSHKDMVNTLQGTLQDIITHMEETGETKEEICELLDSSLDSYSRSHWDTDFKNEKFEKSEEKQEFINSKSNGKEM